MLDIRTQPNHLDKWICIQCNTWNPNDRPKCGLCSRQKPAEQAVQNKDPIDELTVKLHNIVEKLTPLQKQKLYRYFEDNVL